MTPSAGITLIMAVQIISVCMEYYCYYTKEGSPSLDLENMADLAMQSGRVPATAPTYAAIFSSHLIKTNFC